MKRFRTVAIAALVLGLSASTFAMARDHGRGHDRDGDRDGRYRHVAYRGDHDRYRKEYRNRDDRRPPGWSKGKKTGWGNCNLPPGQAKKQGCYDHRYRTNRSRRVIYPTRRPMGTTTRRPANNTSVFRQIQEQERMKKQQQVQQQTQKPSGSVFGSVQQSQRH